MTTIPAYINFSTALARQARYAGRLSVAMLPRLADCLAAREGELHIELEIRAERGGPPHLVGHIGGGVTLICQRCMRAYLQPVSIAVDLRPVTSEAEEARLLRDSDPYLLIDDRLPLHEVIEDEVLLALPMVPYCEHPDCAGGGQPLGADLN